MKTIIVILAIITVAAAIAALTGVEHVSWIGGKIIITHHDLYGRFVAAAFGLICGVSAYGCKGRKMYAWWLVTAMFALFIAYGVIWTIWITITTHLDFLGRTLGALGEGAKVAALIWVLIAWWLPKRNEFNHDKLR